MRVDTVTGVVTLEHDEALGVQQFEALARLANVSLGTDNKFKFTVLPKTKPDVNVVLAMYVPSHSEPWREYTIVRLDNGEIVCSCPDFQHRRSNDGGLCKHIRWRIISLSV